MKSLAEPTMTLASLPFDNSYARLPEGFYARLAPTPVRAPELIRCNRALAELLDIDPASLEGAEALEVLSGNAVPSGASPLAMAYAGHQFGGWVPQLGDGRAILLGEVVGRDGLRRDIQLKGSGPTPFSRMGDGRAALGPVLREYIVSEGMHALGVPTTRALAAVTTGEPVLREEVLPGAILTRIAQSHVRVGTFQFFAARGDTDAIRTLTDYVIVRHYPEAAGAERPARAFLDAVIGRQVALVSRWMALGFIHGVMNTDNMSVAGETIDYGPCAFMDGFRPDKVFSSIDRMGRYAYRNQPAIAQWNLARLAQCLLPLIADEEGEAVEVAQAAIDTVPDLFEAEVAHRFRAKIGLEDEDEAADALVQRLLTLMAADEVDFTATFRGLAAVAQGERGSAALFSDRDGFDTWAADWRVRLKEGAVERMQAVNPYIIPRNHRVEEAIRAAEDHGDFAPFHRMVDALATPFEEREETQPYAEPPTVNQIVTQTFCGT